VVFALMLVYWFIKGVSAIFPDSVNGFYKNTKISSAAIKGKEKGKMI